MHINPYLTFDGRCAEAFRFYETALGGSDLALMPFRGSPMEAHVPTDALDFILHARMTVGAAALMGSDAPPGRFEKAQGMTVSLNTSDVAEAERVFGALAEGGSVTMPLAQTFWAQRFGMVTDRFGTPWMINCE